MKKKKTTRKRIEVGREFKNKSTLSILYKRQRHNVP